MNADTIARNYRPVVALLANIRQGFILFCGCNGMLLTVLDKAVANLCGCWNKLA
jgi:hypothetical protein